VGCRVGLKRPLRAPGYFAKQRNRRGRQLGRVLASCYDEVVVDRLFGGTVQLTKALRPLMEAAEATLKLGKAKRSRTLVRVDAGGGSLDDVNWLRSARLSAPLQRLLGNPRPAFGTERPDLGG